MAMGWLTGGWRGVAIQWFLFNTEGSSLEVAAFNRGKLSRKDVIGSFLATFHLCSMGSLPDKSNRHGLSGFAFTSCRQDRAKCLSLCFDL